MTMSWLDLLFAHWRFEPETIRALLPAGLELDIFEGKAWVAVVPFRMEHVGPRGLNWLPGVSAFPELNVRTYVIADGKPGVWFFSLDAASVVAVRSARTGFHLPYFRAHMSCEERDGWVEYHSERRHPDAPPGEFHGRYRSVGPIYQSTPGTLEHWLTERYCLYARESHRTDPPRRDPPHAVAAAKGRGRDRYLHRDGGLVDLAPRRSADLALRATHRCGWLVARARGQGLRRLV